MFCFLWIVTVIYISWYLFLFSLESDYNTHIRVYVYCFPWIVTMVYILGYMFLLSLDSDYNIHCMLIISVFSG